MWPFLIMWSFLSLSWCSWDIWTLQSSILVLFSFNKWLTSVLSSYNSKFLLSKELILLFLLPVWLLKSIKSSSDFFSLSSKFSKSSISFCLLQTDSYACAAYLSLPMKLMHSLVSLSISSVSRPRNYFTLSNSLMCNLHCILNKLFFLLSTLISCGDSSKSMLSNSFSHKIIS